MCCLSHCAQPGTTLQPTRYAKIYSMLISIIFKGYVCFFKLNTQEVIDI